MSALCNCGHYWAWHGDSGCRVTTSATNCTCTESETTMTDKTPPCVINPTDVRVGDLIELTNSDFPDWLHRDRVTNISGNRIRFYGDEDSMPVEVPGDTRTFRLLDRPEPPKPAPPTEGFIEAWGTAGHRAVHLSVAKCDPDGDWSGLEDDGTGTYLHPDRITRWRAVTVTPVDPSAPKDDDGLRERVERLVENFTENGSYHASTTNDYQRGKGDGLLLAVEGLRYLLGVATETSADA